MKINIVEDDKQEVFELTKSDLEYIKEKFHNFNLEPTDEEALSVIDDNLYYEIKKWGITDTPTRESLRENVIDFLRGDYKSSFQYDYENQKSDDYTKYYKEIHYAGIQKGLTIHNSQKKEEFTMNEKELQEYLQEKNTPKKSNDDSLNYFIFGSMGSGKSIAADAEYFSNIIKKDDNEE